MLLSDPDLHAQNLSKYSLEKVEKGIIQVKKKYCTSSTLFLYQVAENVLFLLATS